MTVPECLLPLLVNGLNRTNSFDQIIFRYIQKTRIYRKFSSYFFQYGFFRYMIGREFPFDYLLDGQVALAVGMAGSTLRIGKSHAMKMKTRIGRTGKLIIIEADASNAKALRDYIKSNSLSNIHLIESGVWNRKCCLEFKVGMIGCSSTSNVVSSIDENEYRRSPRKDWLEVDTIDSLLEKINIEKVDYANITINGAEWEAFSGAMKTVLSAQATFSFVLSNDRTYSYAKQISDLLHSYDYRLVVQRIPTSKGVDFMHAVAVHKSKLPIVLI